MSRPTPRILIALALTLVPAAPASDLAAMVRARMKARPTVTGAPATATPGAGRGNQARCQEKIAGTRRKAMPKGNGSFDFYALNPNFSLVPCEGAEEVDELFKIRYPSSLTGTEPPVWGIGEGANRSWMKIQFGTRPQGERTTHDLLHVGFELIANGKGGSVGIFSSNRDANGNARMALSFNPWDNHVYLRDLHQSREPWAQLRLDDGSLYLGQFGGGAPEGFGWRFEDGMQKGRMGFFAAGVPHGLQIEWQTVPSSVHKQGEPASAARPAAIDHVKKVLYDHGAAKTSEWIQRGAKGWTVAGEPATSTSIGYLARLEQVGAEAKRRNEELAATRRAAFAKLRAGDWVKTTAGWSMVVENAGDGPEKGKVASFGKHEEITDAMDLTVAKPGETVFLAGYGFYQGEPAKKAELETRRLARLKQVQAERKAAKAAAEADARAKAAAFAARMAGPSGGAGSSGSSPSPYPVSGSSLGSPVSSYSPRPGTEAWHDQRRLTNPITYHQNKYNY